ncbi:hypothetical protein GP486_003791 [Trichoglossum hirsutum]|uniref:DUF6536 domain-containing protein n=1 Tax=Trichoglossum hirsutum TaxID=265104 RepID=A0A9P8RQ67_9PEZI|nr:hypothetical protein GP486_003791 [Trichoglossum hirsutum]
MQALSAPTRAEVDREHSKKVWLDIGVMSVRNLWRIARFRVIMWCCLGLSSVPLHLMYNSAVFSTLAANEYAVLVAAPEFLTGNQSSFGTYEIDIVEIRDDITAGRFERLDKEACIREYNKEFVTSRGDLVIIGTAHNSSTTVYTANTYGQPGADINWLCTGLDCRVGLHQGGHIDYCFSKHVKERCRLQFSFYIMIIVIFCNLAKSFIMGLTVWKHRTPTLVTLGDAVSSFLEYPDKSTEDMCLVAKTDILKGVWKQNRSPRVYRPVRNFWFRAVSWQRLLICNFLYIFILSIAGILLHIGVGGIEATSFRDIYKGGLGAVSTNSLVYIGTNGRGPRLILMNVLLANLPQGILSFLYLTYNGLYTCMLNADEWSQFAHQRKTLRVTTPLGWQRSTYYLQLPYTYSLPLLALSGVLHWLTSQSIFLARVTFYGRNGIEDPDITLSTCGYSCFAITLVIMVGSVAVLIGAGMGFRRYPAGIPTAAGCSAAISAACHPLPNEHDAAYLPLKWGVVSEGHCSFSVGPVENPVAGKWYSGRARKKDD